MKTYLYNGVKLPALPAWTTDLMNRELTNALIAQTSDGLYLAHASYNPITFDGENYHVTGSRSYSMIINGEWTPFELAAGGEYYDNGVCVWSNHDILNGDGSVYLAASVPIPANGYEAHLYNGTWQKGTFYKRLHGAWVKHQAYKRQNGAWVKVKE